MSSSWALGSTVVLGLSDGGQTGDNLCRHGECVINLPSHQLWRHVERLASLTGRSPVPAYKADRYRFEPLKFEAAELTPVSSHLVQPLRVAECPLQLEARVTRSIPATEGGFHIVETVVVRVHAHPDVVVSGTSHLDIRRWSPLIYNYRHYFPLGERLGQTFKSETYP